MVYDRLESRECCAVVVATSVALVSTSFLLLLVRHLLLLAWHLFLIVGFNGIFNKKLLLSGCVENMSQQRLAFGCRQWTGTAVLGTWNAASSRGWRCV